MSKKHAKSDMQGVTNPLKARDVNAVSRVTLAIGLRAKKLTYEEIAALAGYSNATACRRAILRELERTVVANVEELRREESVILDKLHASLWEQGIDEKNDKQTWVIDRLLAISERRSKLMGLDVRPGETMGPQIIIEEVPMGYFAGAIVEVTP